MALKFMLSISCCRLDSFACDLSTPHSFVGALMFSSENSCGVQSKAIVVITYSRHIELFVAEIPELGPRMASTSSEMRYK
jgi:hypothetical protein